MQVIKKLDFLEEDKQHVLTMSARKLVKLVEGGNAAASRYVAVTRAMKWLKEIDEDEEFVWTYNTRKEGSRQDNNKKTELPVVVMDDECDLLIDNYGLVSNRLFGEQEIDQYQDLEEAPTLLAEPEQYVEEETLVAEDGDVRIVKVFMMPIEHVAKHQYYTSSGDEFHKIPKMQELKSNNEDEETLQNNYSSSDDEFDEISKMQELKSNDEEDETVQNNHASTNDEFDGEEESLQVKDLENDNNDRDDYYDYYNGADNDRSQCTTL